MKAILFEVDKCVKCRACVVACKRNWSRNPGPGNSHLTGKMLGAVGNAEAIAPDNPVVVKGQTAADRKPWVRYSCWHCAGPVCKTYCPRKAIIKDPDTGAVYIKHVGIGPLDTEYCKPETCEKQCFKYCNRGGYPRVGQGDEALNEKAYKCMMCYGRTLPGQELDKSDGTMKPDNVPACVLSCVAGALKYGEIDVIKSYANNKYANQAYTGNVIWAGNHAFSVPTADPFVEDHISPMLGMLLRSPAGKAVVVPSLLVGGVYALYARRISLANQVK